MLDRLLSNMNFALVAVVLSLVLAAFVGNDDDDDEGGYQR